MSGLIGMKLGMTQVFDETGALIPCTVVEAGPCAVVQIRAEESEGYRAVQLGWGGQKKTRASQAELGHAKKAGLEVAPAVLREFKVTGEETYEPGQTIAVSDVFEAGNTVKVTGTTIGKGFQGVVKRWNFAGGPAAHGNTMHRVPGSIGPGTNPSRVIKGKKLPGHMGARQQTVLNLRVVKVDPTRNLIYLRGAVPGPEGGVVFITKNR